MRLMRFGLATRFLAISATALLTLWLVLIVLFYRTGDLTDAATRLPPAQLSAMTELLAGHARRAKAAGRYGRCNLPWLSVSLAPAATALKDGQDVSGEAEFAAYRNLAAGRLLSVRLTPPPERLVRLRPMRRSAQPLIFRSRADQWPCTGRRGAHALPGDLLRPARRRRSRPRRHAVRPDRFRAVSPGSPPAHPPCPGGRRHRSLGRAGDVAGVPVVHAGNPVADPRLRPASEPPEA